MENERRKKHARCQPLSIRLSIFIHARIGGGVARSAESKQGGAEGLGRRPRGTGRAARSAEVQKCIKGLWREVRAALGELRPPAPRVPTNERPKYERLGCVCVAGAARRSAQQVLYYPLGELERQRQLHVLEDLAEEVVMSSSRHVHAHVITRPDRTHPHLIRGVL